MVVSLSANVRNRRMGRGNAPQMRVQPPRRFRGAKRDTGLACQILDYYGLEWVNFDPPSFLHPDREHLWKIEETLQRITAFEESPQNHPLLAPTIASLRDDLSSVLSSAPLPLPNPGRRGRRAPR
jgi:hypothetical protein